MAAIENLGRQTGLSDAQIVALVNALVETARGGERVYIRNFGTFSVRVRPPRTIKSPVIPGGEKKLPERKVLEFRMSPKLAAVLNAGGKARGVAPAPAPKRRAR
jgi:nucleoid DNA-binding protein